MAFTADQKAAIREYLGFSQLFFQIDPRLESQMDSLPTTVPSAVAIVTGLLTDLAAIDSAIQTAALNNLTLSKAEDVTFLGPLQLEALRDQGRMKITQLAVIFEVQAKRDYFATGEGNDGGVVPLG